jgi:hypothetical protein
LKVKDNTKHDVKTSYYMPVISKLLAVAEHLDVMLLSAEDLENITLCHHLSYKQYQ